MKSLVSALRVLNEFASALAPLGVVELADRLGQQKSQTSKILKAFRDAGLLVQDPDTRKYSVGVNAFALGNKFVNANPLSREALPVMRKLVDKTGHSAVLSVLHGGDIIHLLAVEGRLFIDGRWRVGRWMPYHSTSAGKVLLAFSPPELMDELLRTRGLPPITPNTITDERTFRALVQKTRRRGYATSRSENYPGSASIAVPLFRGGAEAVAALGLICPEHLFTATEAEVLVRPVWEAARELSSRIGADVYPFGA